MTLARDTEAGMRFHVDAWDPTYGSSVEDAEIAVDSTAKITANVEREPRDWSPIVPTAVPEPGAVLFIDGVRRIEARIWIDQPPAADTETGEILGADSVMALCASYASGAVCCCADQR